MHKSFCDFKLLNKTALQPRMNTNATKYIPGSLSQSVNQELQFPQLSKAIATFKCRNWLIHCPIMPIVKQQIDGPKQSKVTEQFWGTLMRSKRLHFNGRNPH